MHLPVRTRDKFKWNACVPKINKLQDNNCGIPNNKIVDFEPIIVTEKPATMFPKIPPIERIDPIHERSLTDNGPDSNGEFGDVKSGSAGLNQPIPLPNFKKHYNKCLILFEIICSALTIAQSHQICCFDFKNNINFSNIQ